MADRLPSFGSIEWRGIDRSTMRPWRDVESWWWSDMWGARRMKLSDKRGLEDGAEQIS